MHLGKLTIYANEPSNAAITSLLETLSSARPTSIPNSRKRKSPR